MDDDKRQLTKKGKEKFVKAAPGIKKLLPGNLVTHIFTSPLPRAYQTAKILAEELNNTRVDTHDFIATGDTSMMFDALDKVPWEDSVVIVGHEPYLGDWSRQFCGAALPFKKGAAAAISFDEKGVFKGSLLWFMQPKALRNLKGQKNAE